ncbi:NBS-containing resistance-like protein, partial [Trifolium pratense]
MAMNDEYNALIENKTWELVPCPSNANVIRSNGANQQSGVDCGETFSPVVKPATIRIVLSIALSKSWCLHQLDVKNAFLHGNLDETVYMHHPPGFRDPRYHEHEIIERAGMSSCKPSPTPVDTKAKLSGSSGNPCHDPTEYRSLAGALQYLTFTRPDISYAVQQVCLFMHDPKTQHMSALKRIIRYIHGTIIDFGLHLYPSSVTKLVSYTDADWAGCPDTRRSTSGYCVYLGDNLISWSAKRQHTLSRSSAKAEYRGVANVICH